MQGELSVGCRIIIAETYTDHSGNERTIQRFGVITGETPTRWLTKSPYHKFQFLKATGKQVAGGRHTIRIATVQECLEYDAYTDAELRERILKGPMADLSKALNSMRKYADKIDDIILNAECCLFELAEAHHKAREKTGKAGL